MNDSKKVPVKVPLTVTVFEILLFEEVRYCLTPEGLGKDFCSHFVFDFDCAESSERL